MMTMSIHPRWVTPPKHAWRVDMTKSMTDGQKSLKWSDLKVGSLVDVATLASETPLWIPALVCELDDDRLLLGRGSEKDREYLRVGRREATPAEPTEFYGVAKNVPLFMRSTELERLRREAH